MILLFFDLPPLILCINCSFLFGLSILLVSAINCNNQFFGNRMRDNDSKDCQFSPFPKWGAGANLVPWAGRHRVLLLDFT